MPVRLDDGKWGADLLASLRKITKQMKLVPASLHANGHGRNKTDSLFLAESFNDYAFLGIDMEGVVQSTNDIFSPVVQECFLEPMRYIGVDNLSHTGDFAKVDETVQEGGTHALDFNHKANFLFAPMMVRDKKMSLLNNKNEPEFVPNEQGGMDFNYNFWSANLNIKRNKITGSTFTNIDIAAIIPTWSLSEFQLRKHTAAMEFMPQHGPTFPNKKAYFLNIKNEYATVFLRNMKSDLVAKAGLAGWMPLFLMKNAIISKTKQFGLNGVQVTTVNLQPKSYLAMVGFFKGNDKDLQIITLTDVEKKLVVIENDST